MTGRKNKVKNKSSNALRQNLARYCAALVVLCIVLGYYFSAVAYTNPFYPYTDVSYVTQNWGLTFILLGAVCAYILKRLQGGIYWFFWLQLQKTNPDERQRAVRRRVFERAYVIALIFILLVAPAAVQAIARYANPARDDLLSRASWIATIFFVSLPSMLASLQKDS